MSEKIQKIYIIYNIHNRYIKFKINVLYFCMKLLFPVPMLHIDASKIAVHSRMSIKHFSIHNVKLYHYAVR